MGSQPASLMRSIRYLVNGAFAGAKRQSFVGCILIPFSFYTLEQFRSSETTPGGGPLE
jgi:hypothetical protein